MTIKSLNKLSKEEMKLISGGVKKQFVVHCLKSLTEQDRELAILSLITNIQSGFNFIGENKSFSDKNLRKIATRILDSESKTWKFFSCDNEKGPDFHLDIYVDF